MVSRGKRERGKGETMLRLEKLRIVFRVCLSGGGKQKPASVAEGED